jgi:hypothetical protein
MIAVWQAFSLSHYHVKIQWLSHFAKILGLLIGGRCVDGAQLGSPFQGCPDAVTRKHIEDGSGK